MYGKELFSRREKRGDVNKETIQTKELKRLTHELKRMNDIEEQRPLVSNIGKRRVKPEFDLGLPEQRKKRRFIDTDVNKAETKPILPCVILLSSSESQPLIEEDKKEISAEEMYKSYLAEAYKNTHKANDIDLNEIPLYKKNANIIEKLRAKRTKEQERLKEIARQEVRKQEELKRQEEAKQREAKQREEQKKSQEVKVSGTAYEMAKRYYKFRVHVNTLVANKTIPESRCTEVRDFLNQTFNSMAKTNYQNKINDIINFYNTMVNHKDTPLEQYFIYTITKVLYPQIKENSKVTARDNVGRDMTLIYARVFTQISGTIPGLINYLISFCCAKSPLLIPDVHPLGITEQEYRIKKGYRDPLSPGETKRFNDTMKFRGKGLKGMTIFYCGLVQCNQQYVSQAWVTLCKLLNSHAINHTPVLIDVLIFELGELFARCYGKQYINLLNFIKSEYVPYLRTEADKFVNESEIFKQKVDSFLYIVNDQLIKYHR